MIRTKTAPPKYTRSIQASKSGKHTIVADCGTGLADEAMRALLDHTHTLLLVATSCEDAVMLAEKTLHWLAGHGYPHLVENCIAVMCHASSTRGAPRTVRSRFAGLCATVIDIPADPQLAQGGAIRLDELTIDVQTAYASVAAAVVDAAPPDATAGQRSWARSLSSSPLASARHTGR